MFQDKGWGCSLKGRWRVIAWSQEELTVMGERKWVQRDRNGDVPGVGDVAG